MNERTNERTNERKNERIYFRLKPKCVLVLHCHQDKVDDLNVAEIAREFARMTPDEQLLETSLHVASCVSIILHCNAVLSNFMSNDGMGRRRHEKVEGHSNLFGN